jgi:hypothetical protein
MKPFFFSGNSNASLSHWKSKRGYLAALIVMVASACAIADESYPSLLSSIQSSMRSQVGLLSGRSQSPQTELPVFAILIALGHDSEAVPLQNFADHVERQLRRQVVTYRQFANAHYISQTGKWWNNLPYDQVTGIVEQAIRRAVDRYPNSKIIAFNLDGYSPKELSGPDGKEVVSYTNFEVHLLLHERRLFLATRWYRNSRELSLDEAEAFWAPVIAALGWKQCLLRHLRLKWVHHL